MFFVYVLGYMAFLFCLVLICVAVSSLALCVYVLGSLVFFVHVCMCRLLHAVSLVCVCAWFCCIRSVFSVHACVVSCSPMSLLFVYALGSLVLFLAMTPFTCLKV